MKTSREKKREKMVVYSLSPVFFIFLFLTENGASVILCLLMSFDLGDKSLGLKNKTQRGGKVPQYNCTIT